MTRAMLVAACDVMCEDSEDSLMGEQEDESEWDADAPPVDQTAARAAAKAAAELLLRRLFQSARSMPSRTLVP